MYRMVIDTETAPFRKGAIQPGLVYDLGFAVIDDNDLVVEGHSYIISNIFDNEPDRMNSAHYKNKIPRYIKGIEEGEHEKVTFLTARKRLFDTCKKYNIKDIYAHNAQFDFNALDFTYNYVTNGRCSNYFPEEYTIHCTNKMAKKTIRNKEEYIEFCNKHGFVTKTGTPQTKAEIVYRYISKNPEFIESHTGLQDVLIEKDIMSLSLSINKEEEGILFEPTATFRPHKKFLEKIGEVAWLPFSSVLYYNGEDSPPSEKFYHIISILSRGILLTDYTKNFLKFVHCAYYAKPNLSFIISM